MGRVRCGPQRIDLDAELTTAKSNLLARREQPVHPISGHLLDVAISYCCAQLLTREFATCRKDDPMQYPCIKSAPNGTTYLEFIEVDGKAQDYISGTPQIKASDPVRVGEWVFVQLSAG